ADGEQPAQCDKLLDPDHFPNVGLRPLEEVVAATAVHGADRKAECGVAHGFSGVGGPASGGAVDGQFRQWHDSAKFWRTLKIGRPDASVTGASSGRFCVAWSRVGGRKLGPVPGP